MKYPSAIEFNQKNCDPKGTFARIVSGWYTWIGRVVGTMYTFFGVYLLICINL